SSTPIVKRTYTTECPLANVLWAKYKSYRKDEVRPYSHSYRTSRYFPSLLIATQTPRKKRIMLYPSALLIVAFSLASVFIGHQEINYFYNRNDAVREVRFLIVNIICVRTFYFFLNGFLKKDGADGATVYFNSSRDNCLESSDDALFNSSTTVEI
ncbi:hypothetical protein V1517DRAFT_238792, partial [Lipomyces orientalis]